MEGGTLRAGTARGPTECGDSGRDGAERLWVAECCEPNLGLALGQLAVVGGGRTEK